MNKTEIYVDLSKRSAEEIKNLGVAIRKSGEAVSPSVRNTLSQGYVLERWHFLTWWGGNWTTWSKIYPEDGKTEMEYEDFIKFLTGKETFISRMAFEMEDNKHKGDWREFSVPENRLEILSEIQHHYNKLRGAVAAGEIERIREYASDIGNIAMFMYASTKN